MVAFYKVLLGSTSIEDAHSGPGSGGTAWKGEKTSLPAARLDQHGLVLDRACFCKDKWG